ncbi:hypothetical protein [Frigoribacterium sp. SL97]|uniref:hypothetical protein n=1 Tax=Frigoribacterium sp. SL97 TaxID=2994664 RepID=UPI00226F6963|nr:hypothetical protein [Frigoribacterium sp. SL97]WAC50384.1 hypothetical protein OVA02_10815 [Frigoribacterium sp. SL97]
MSTPPTKHILLDFEGVVSAELNLAAAADAGHDVGRFTMTEVPLPSDASAFVAVFDPAVVSRINALATVPGVSIHWLTCVGHHVPRTIAPAIGLDDFPNSAHASDIPGQEGWPGTNWTAGAWW